MAMAASTWGNPTATKHVLLLHGLTCSSPSWHHIATQLASRGYFVTAPDLHGHGHATRCSDYSIAAWAHELRSYLEPPEGNDHPYHIVIGHSLGAIVASLLLPSLKATQSVRVVLIDPPLELTPDQVAFYAAYLHDGLANPISPDEYQHQLGPLSTREDAIFSWFSARLCDPAVVHSVLDPNKPWSFSYHLSAIPHNVNVTVLAADPSKMPCVSEAQLEPFPHVTAKTVWGASHLIPIEYPQVVIETALQGTDSTAVAPLGYDQRLT